MIDQSRQPVWVVTGNAFVKVKDKNVKADVVSTVEKYGLLCSQEMGEHTEIFPSLRDDHGLGVYHGDLPGASSTPVIWDRTVWTKVRAECWLLTKAERLPDNPRVAGGARVKTKVANVVWLERKSDGRRIIVISLHLPASLWWPPRMRLAKKMMAEVSRRLHNLSDEAQVFIGGDYNIESRVARRLTGPLMRQGFKSAQRVYRKPTHGNRAIDDVYHRGRYSVIATRALTTHSDHRYLATCWRPRK